jgi:dTDP-glucose 4,6-dehydratase
MVKFFITGGAGFIGSHICEEIFRSFKNSKIIIYDKLTYAGNKKYLKNIIKSKRVKFIRGDILDYKKYSQHIKNSDYAINVAAESHVDNSFNNPISFTMNNTVGAHVFFLNCIEGKVKKIIQISSDEIYGEKLKGKCNEQDKIEPTNPYSASKAAAEIIINSHKYGYKKEIITIRGNNIYGIKQYPEKLIPRCILSLIKNKKIPIHGNGRNIRYYLSAVDFSKAIIKVLKKTKKGIYNVGNTIPYSNNEVAKLICKLMNKNPKKYIQYVEDRPYNDRRYSISINKIKKLGWKPEKQLIKDLPSIIDWYKNNYKLFNKFKLN